MDPEFETYASIIEVKEDQWSLFIIPPPLVQGGGPRKPVPVAKDHGVFRTLEEAAQEARRHVESIFVQRLDSEDEERYAPKEP